MERSDVWLLSGYTFRGVAVLFRSATLTQSTPTLLHISAIVRRVMNTAVTFLWFLSGTSLKNPITAVILLSRNWAEGPDTRDMSNKGGVATGGKHYCMLH